MSKVKCKVCANETKSMCKLRKSGIKINKPRICDDFIFAPLKVKVHTEIPTVKFGYAEEQEAKRQRRAQLKELRAEIAKATEGTSKEDLGKAAFEAYSSARDTKHPLTGDLSRFLTTASEG